MKLAYAYRKSTFYPHRGQNRMLPPPNLREAYLSKVRSLGFEGFDLSLESLGGIDASARAVKRLRRELEELGLPCVAFRCKGSVSDDWDAEENRALLRKSVRAAGWLGAGILNMNVIGRVLPGKQGDLHGKTVTQGSSRTATEADFAITARRLARVADLAADSSVDLAVEVHNSSIVDNSWSALRMLELIDRPNVSLNPDIKNIHWAYDEPEKSSEDAILAMARHAIYWHCKNITRIPLPKKGYTVFVRNALPDGDIDYRFAVAAMLDAGYDGYLAIEGNIHGDQLDVDGRSPAYARSLIEELANRLTSGPTARHEEMNPI